MSAAELDYIDMSLWDCFKEPNEPEFAGRNLMEWFNDLDRGDVRLGVAGKIMTAEESQACLEYGMDFVLIGRAAILHHDYPKLAMANPAWEPIAMPVSEEHLLNEVRTESEPVSHIPYLNPSFAVSIYTSMYTSV